MRTLGLELVLFSLNYEYYKKSYNSVMLNIFLYERANIQIFHSIVISDKL